MGDLPSLSEVVKFYKLDADKRLGQHFLLDQNVTDKIVKYAHPLNSVSIAEIGPGPGGLTRSLLKAGAEKILAIEMDERFLPALADIGRAHPDRLTVFKGDALKVNITEHLSGEIKIIANLPYNVGTQLLINWLTARPLFWSQCVLMFQKEVADRITASPGEKAYGRLAVLAQSVCQCRQAFDIPARAFSPPPKVDSAVIVLDPLPQAQRFTDLDILGELTRAAFGQRRKMLRKSLKNFAAKYDLDMETWLETVGVNPTDRPEVLAVSAFQDLVKNLPALSEGSDKRS